MSNRNNNKLVLIFLLAFLIRLLFVVSSVYVPQSDAMSYDSLGWSITQGKGYTDNDGTPHSSRPPFYPFFLSVVYFLFGHSYTAARIIQSLLGAISCILAYMIARRLIGDIGGYILAFILALYPPFIRSAGLLLTELIFTLFLLLIVLYIFKLREKPVFSNAAILGVLIAMASLTRGVMLPFIFFISFMFFRKGFLNKYIVMLLFFIMALLPWTIRNYIVFNNFIPVSTQLGSAFYSSYKPENGIFGMNASLKDPVVIEANNIKSPTLRSNFFVKKTLDFIRKNPIEVLRLEIKKIMYFWAPFDWEIVGNRWFNLIYVILFPFFIIGFFLSLRDVRKFAPILLLFIYFQIVTLIFYGSPRFRLPLEPFIFLIAISGILQIKEVLNNGIFPKK